VATNDGMIIRICGSILHNGSQINVVKDMKNKILEIAQWLEKGEITELQARKLLLRLFVVSGSLPLPDFLYNNGYGCILTGVYGDSDVSDEWEKWKDDVFGNDR
jgi:hypothetical protein